MPARDQPLPELKHAGRTAATLLQMPGAIKSEEPSAKIPHFVIIGIYTARIGGVNETNPNLCELIKKTINPKFLFPLVEFFPEWQGFAADFRFWFLTIKPH
jgi:hypothetical protein